MSHCSHDYAMAMHIIYAHVYLFHTHRSSDEEIEGDDGKARELRPKTLPWRSIQVQQYMTACDAAYELLASEQAKRQRLRRLPHDDTHMSIRPKPTNLPAWAERSIL